MNTSSLATTLLQELQQGQGLQQLGQQLGIDQNQTRQAVGAAIPLLLGAMGRNTSEPAGAQALLGALQRDHASGPDLGSLLGSVLGGGGSSAQTNGAGILGHIFGGDTPRAASGLGNATGLDSGRAGQLLALLAPIVMSFLARRFVGSGGSGGSAAAGGDASQLGHALEQERQNSGIGDILGSVLDQDGDGQFGASDLMKLGAGLFNKRG